MTAPSINFSGTIPQNYEDLLGPFVFEPFAIDLARRLELTGTQNILELACGSGRLTKHIAIKLPATANFIASDLNADMISVAKTKVTLPGANWAVADMLAIPYPENEFDLVVCQFGVMLVPDQMKALSEIFRVLKPGGKLFFSTWGPIASNPLWNIASKVLNRFLNKNPLLLNPGPFAMSNNEVVLQQLSKTGFNICTATSVPNIGTIESAKMAAEGFIKGLPVLSFIMAQGPELLPEIIATFEAELSQQLGNSPMKAKQRAWVFEAVK